MERGPRAATWLAVGAAALGIGLGLYVARSGPADEATPAPGSGPAVAAPAVPRPAFVSAGAASSAPATGTVSLEVSTLRGPAPTARVRLFAGAPPRSAMPWRFVRDVPLDGEATATFSLEPGPHLLTAESDGAFTSHALEVFPGQRQTVWLTLEPTWRAALRVVEQDSRAPVRDAQVELVMRKERTGFPVFFTGRRWSGDSLGRVVLDGLPSGEVSLRVTSATHLPGRVNLPENAEGEREVALEPASFAEGTVRDENGTPIEHALVSTADEYEARTDATGAFRLAAAPGDALLAAVDPAGRSATARAHLPERGTVRGIDIRLGDPLRVAGVVVDALSNEPVPGVTVVAEPPHGDTIVARTVTNAQGRFELDGLPPGWVALTATLGRGARGRLPSVASDEPKPVEIRLEAASALWGTVTDSTGRQIPGAQVQVRSQWSGGVAQATADETGTWRLDDLAPGAVRVTAAAGAEAQSLEQGVQLTSGAALRVDLKVERTGTIDGVVTGPGGPWFVFASLGSPGRVQRRTITRADGTFSLRVPPGEWALSPSPLNDLMIFDGTVVEVGPGQTQHVRLEAPAPRTEQDIMDDLGAFAEEGTLGCSFEARGPEVIVSWLGTRTPASLAGLQVGDVLLAIDGQPVRDASDAFARSRGEPGSRVRLTLRTPAGQREVDVQRAKAGKKFPQK